LPDGPNNPPHHTFLLSESEPNSSREDGAAACVRGTALALFLLPPSLGEVWLLLLEQHSIQQGSGPSGLVPPLTDGDLRAQRGELSQELQKMGFGALRYDISPPTTNEQPDNNYWFLPSQLSQDGLARFRHFYEDELRSSHVIATPVKTKHVAAWDVSLDTGQAWDTFLEKYRNTARAHPDRLPHLCSQIVSLGTFDELIQHFSNTLDSELANIDGDGVKNEVALLFERTLDTVKRIRDDAKREAVSFARFCARLAAAHVGLVKWRWEDLTEYVRVLAAVTKEAPLCMSLQKSVRALPGQSGRLEELKLEPAMDVAIEYSEAFVEAFRRTMSERRSGALPVIHWGVGHHYSSLILHPASVARGLIVDPQGHFLRKGGVVVV